VSQTKCHGRHLLNETDVAVVAQSNQYGADMQSVQVSVWIPILVAVLGIVGVILGQAVNAWRENKKLAIEGEREKIRLEHDDRKDMRTERLKAYSDFLSTWKEWMTSIESLQHIGEHDEGDGVVRVDWAEARELLLSSNSRLSDAWARIELLGSGDVVRVARRAREIGAVLYEKYVHIRRHVGDLSKHRTAMDAMVRDYISAVQGPLLGAFRADLGTDPFGYPESNR
jgi:hypothetical protein